jgi:predicted nucleic acid-binding protein
MTVRGVFVDSNILIYAHDRTAGIKGDLARRGLSRLWEQDIPSCLSVQVLQEFYVNLLKKSVAPDEARDAVKDYLVWQVVVNDTELLLRGMDEERRWKVAYWDGLILAAARRAKAEILWSEDFSTGQDYDGIQVINPLVPERAEKRSSDERPVG